ncbi:MAG TPA: class I SAM-dependent methyltransferase [Candidatus Angelobacter sp.]|jgi:2-polyprenyl-3-methyl-5-hydroxy-6-metoxy-1,4-benzoquinol methylase|nr:class I SAM-dependent methyltransferase [Candidatus Angelobacter sp.]
MELDEKASWNKKYSEGSHSSLDPDPFLVSAYDEFLFDTTPGLVLDIAGGVGRHAIWLAQHGWRVKLLDIAEVGIKQVKENAKRAGTSRSISAEVCDLNAMQNLGREQYDLVIVFFFLQRELFRALLAAIKPGGILIYKTYTTEQKNFSGGPSHPMFLLEANELLRAFSAMRVLHYHETIQEKGVAELVARK